MSDSSSKQTSRESILYQCEGHTEVFSNSEISSYVAWLRAQVNLEGDLFSEMYLSLLHRFSDWTQSLKQSGLHWEDPIFNYGIARAKALLEMNEVMLKKRTEDEEILRFFLFSVGLLQDIGSIASDRKIFICNEQGEFKGVWEPMVSSLVASAKFYKVRHIQDQGHEYRNAMTVLIASKIMPDHAISWMNENSNRMVQWLQSIVNPEEGFSQMGMVYDPKKLAEKIKKNITKAIQFKTSEPKETLAGEKYWAWLKKQIESGKMKVGGKDSYAHLVEGGLFLEHERMFRDFSKVYSEYRDWVVVYKQFNHLGITRLSGQDYKFEQYFSEVPNNTITQNRSMFSKIKTPINKDKSRSITQTMFPKLTKDKASTNNPQKQMQGHLILNPHMFINPAALGTVNQQMKSSSKSQKSGLLTRLLFGVMGIKLTSSRGH